MYTWDCTGSCSDGDHENRSSSSLDMSTEGNDFPEDETVAACRRSVIKAQEAVEEQLNLIESDEKMDMSEMQEDIDTGTEEASPGVRTCAAQPSEVVRNRNNLAARRSRKLKKCKEDMVAFRAAFLEQENLTLRSENLALRREVKFLRSKVVM